MNLLYKDEEEARRAIENLALQVEQGDLRTYNEGINDAVKRVDAQLPEIKKHAYNEGVSDTNKKWGIGLAAGTAIVGVGVGVYAVGKKKGWWSKR